MSVTETPTAAKRGADGAAGRAAAARRCFSALAALFLFRLGAGDPSRIPSALIGQPAPADRSAAVAGLERDGKPVPGLDSADVQGRGDLLNVWASWCVPCHDEAPLLVKLAADKRIRIVGINYKDQPDNARRFLGRYGNPFAAIGADPNGRAAIEWGVYGVPETFLVGRDGRIAYKLVGPITPENLRKPCSSPQIEKALAAHGAPEQRSNLRFRASSGLTAYFCISGNCSAREHEGERHHAEHLEASPRNRSSACARRSR